MRLRKLDLLRFGCFTNHTIDFGDAKPGEPDIHVIFGENEAGKSTIFAAYLDLLFGIKPQSPHGFLHPYDTMQIMATLEQEGVTRTIKRIKKSQLSLLDGQGDILPEGTLAPYLNGLSRDQCLAMFSMDDESIEKGGDDILASKGETGALLFAASTGLSNFSETLGRLNEEANSFHKKAGRKTHIRLLKDDLQALKDEKAKFDIQVSYYERCRKDRDAAQALYVAAEKQRRALAKVCDDITRQIRGLPLHRQLNDLEQKLKPLEALKMPKAGWKEQARKLQQDIATLETPRTDLPIRHEKLVGKLAGLARDAAALPLKSELEALQQQHASFLTAERDLPARRNSREAATRNIADTLARLGRPGEADPVKLLLSDAAVRNIGDLIATRSSFEITLASAAKEFSNAQAKLVAHDELHPPVEASGTDISHDALAALIKSLEAQDILADLRNAKQDAERKQNDLAEALELLKPWKGNVQTLDGLQVPSLLTLRDWCKRRDGFAAAHANHAKVLDDIARLCGELLSTRDSVRETTQFMTDAELAELRGQREAVWNAHLVQFDISTAKVFEDVLRLHDAAMERRIGQMSSATNLQVTVEQLLKAQDKLRRESEKQAECEQQLTLLDQTYATWRGAIGFPAAFAVTADEMETWLDRRKDALAKAAVYARAEIQFREKSDIASEASRRLQRVLTAVHVTSDERSQLDELLNFARAITDGDLKRRQLRDTRTSLEADVKMRAREEAATREVVATWDRHWRDALGSTWLGSAEARSPADVSGVLSQLDVLKNHLREYADLDDRIQKMEQDQQQFMESLNDLSIRFSMLDNMAPLQLFKAMEERARNAWDAQKDEERLHGELKEWERDKGTYNTTEANCQARLHEMIAFYEVDTLDDVITCIGKVEVRERFAEQFEQKQLELRHEMQSDDLVECRAALSALNAQELEAELVKVSEQREAQDLTCKGSFAAVQKAEDALAACGGDDRAALLEQQARTKCLEIDDKVLDYVRLKAGVMATERALTMYREKHQSSMMQAASQTFAQITNGRYVRLQSQPSRDTEELVAVARDGSSKAAQQMSKGTRFQLYLALRAAGYQEFSKTRPPLPFIADDILETFDDKRSSRTFELLAGMAQTGQVIYLAHHRHLCDMASTLIPNVRIHELP